MASVGSFPSLAAARPRIFPWLHIPLFPAARSRFSGCRSSSATHVCAYRSVRETMTAVLPPGDPLRFDRIMSPLDDNQINYASNDAEYWKAKYQDEADRLAETLSDLDEFQRSSKELEDELEKDLERNEKAQQESRVKAAKAETERDEWKSKFMHLQTTHNMTTTSLQRELDTLRQAHQKLQVQMRDLEMGNDDLERNERAASSSLADAEARYGKVLEEKILLEHELLDKASLEEECQRLKDDLRDANLEVTVQKERLDRANEQIKSLSRSSTLDSSSSSAQTTSIPATATFPEDDLLKTNLASELMLTDLMKRSSSTSTLSSSESSTNADKTLKKESSASGHSVLLRRAGFPAAWMNGLSPSPPPNGSSMTRSHTVSTYSPSRLPTTPRPMTIQRKVSEASSVTSTVAAKSRGVQMVSEMRAKVKNLEQRLHTRVPRIRLASITARNALNGASSSAHTPENPRTSLQRRSADLEAEKKRAPITQKSGDSSGWVLIMEDSMSPTPTKDQDGRRRLSSPTSSPIYNAMTSRKASSAGNSQIDFGRSNIGRPSSRLSGPADGRDSISTISTTSSIQTPNSRPSTPTFLPVPTSGLYASGIPPMKRSTGPMQVKRTSLGSNPDSPSYLQPPISYRERPSSVQSAFAASTNKSLPQPPSRTRPPSALGQSRIGRPTSLGSGRKSAGGSDNEVLLSSKDSRPRAGSTAASGRPVNRAI